jgi:Ca-activated chloride channel family protein
VLAALWARTRIDDLMSQDYAGIQSGNARADVKESITALGLNYRLMTQFTSFVAVEEMTVTDGGEPRRVEVPVEMPEGVSHEGVFGEEKDKKSERIQVMASLQQAPAKAMPSNAQSGSGAIGNNPVPMASAEVPRESVRDEDRGRGQISNENQKRQQVLAKLHPSIAAVVERLKNRNAQPAADESKFVRNGKAEIQIWLADKSPETLAKLKQLGFEIVLDPKTARMVIGRVAIEKLAAIAELNGVRYITPQM